jgi:hypothetical protein
MRHKWTLGVCPSRSHNSRRSSTRQSRSVANGSCSGGHLLATTALFQTSKQNVLSKYQLTENLSIGGQAVYASEVFGGLFAAGQTAASLTDPSVDRFEPCLMCLPIGESSRDNGLCGGMLPRGPSRL